MYLLNNIKAAKEWEKEQGIAREKAIWDHYTIYRHHPIMRGVSGVYRDPTKIYTYPYWCDMYDADDQLMATHKATLKEFAKLENTFNGGFRKFVHFSDAITAEQIPLVMTIRVRICTAGGELFELPHKVFKRSEDRSIWEYRPPGRKPSSDPQLRNPRWSTNQE
jgi:hypothetical protein